MTMTREQIVADLRKCATGKLPAHIVARTCGLLADAIDAHLTSVGEPVAEVYHEGNFTTLSRWHDGARELPDGDHLLYVAQPAQSVDIRAIREVIAYLKKGHRFDAEMADKLTAALQEPDRG